jgi:hypothetical protein
VFEWMFEGHWAGYTVLVALAVIFLITWWSSRKRAFLYAFGVSILLILGYALLDRAVETDREQIANRLIAMGKAVKDRKPDVIVSNLSDDFHSGTMDKKAFQAKVETAISDRYGDDLIVWEFEFPSEGRTEKSRPVHFQAKLLGGRFGDDTVYYYIKSHFVQNADGQWRLKDLEAFRPPNYTDPLPIDRIP